MRRFLYWSLMRVSSYGYRINRRFTRPGLLALIGLVATGTIGIDTTQTLAYQLFTFLLFLILCAIAQSWFFKPHFEVKRSLPSYATAGEPFSYRVEVRNLGDRPEIGLSVLENLVDPRPSFKVFKQNLAPLPKSVGWLRRFSIWDKWQRMVGRNRPARIEEQPLPLIPPGQAVEITPEVTPVRRGSIELSGLTIARPDRFGLFKGFEYLRQPQSLPVLPKRYPVPELELPGVRRYQHGGVVMTASVGDSEEFIGLRDYRPGDPLKNIHWKSFARIGCPVVKEHQNEFFVRHALVLDTFTIPGTAETFEEAVSIAASFASSIETQECLLDLLFVGADTYCFTAGRGQLHTENMLEILAHAMPCEDRPFSVLQEAVIQRRPMLSGCILVLLAWDEPRRRLADELRASGLPLLVLLVSDEAAPVDAEQLHVLRPGRMLEGLAAL